MNGDIARRNQRKFRKNCLRNQAGGNIGANYAVVPTSVVTDNPSLGAARIDSISSCVAQTSPSTITPPPAVGLPGFQRGGRYGFDMSSPVVASGASLGLSGYPEVVSLGGCEGGAPLRQQGGAPGGVGSPYTIAPTAGYGNVPSPWVSAVGAPVEIQVPYNARASTCGGARQRRHLRKTQRRSKRRNTRKSAQKKKKGSRKH